MPFDPVSWAVGYAASKATSSLLEKIFDVGAYREIQGAATKWSSELPEDIRTPSEALFDTERSEDEWDSLSRLKLKRVILELHKIPTAQEWFDALVESWEFKRQKLGAHANAFFQLDRPVAEERLRELAEAIFAACASVLKYSQPLIVNAIRELGVTQSLILNEIKTFRSPLNSNIAGRNEAIAINFDPTHIEESQLHRLNEVVCVDSPGEVIAGRYRTHEIWIGPSGCNKEEALYIPIQARYVENKTKSLLTQWNLAAVDLAKQDVDSVIAAMASFHHKFLEVHPYPDGNGRLARAILDLQVRNFTPVQSSLRLKSYDEYYLSLKAADAGKLGSLKTLIGDIVSRELGNELSQRPGT
jgi:Fic/DOC family